MPGAVTGVFRAGADPPGAVERNLLVVMAKEPAAGVVKTRMVPFLGEDEAAELYGALLEDTLDLADQVEGAGKAVAFSPASARSYFRRLVSRETLLFPQPDGQLGEKLQEVCRQAFATGAGAVCLLNSDGPDLPPGRIREAFLRLNSGEAGVVFGPNPDGGYYLVGLRSAADIFRDVPWSTGRVLEASLERAAGAGLRTSLLEPWPDLDTPGDLADAFTRWQSGLAAPPERTYRFLNRLAAAGRFQPGSW